MGIINTITFFLIKKSPKPAFAGRQESRPQSKKTKNESKNTKQDKLAITQTYPVSYAFFDSFS